MTLCTEHIDWRILADVDSPFAISPDRVQNIVRMCFQDFGERMLLAMFERMYRDGYDLCTFFGRKEVAKHRKWFLHLVNEDHSQNVGVLSRGLIELSYYILAQLDSSTSELAEANGNRASAWSLFSREKRLALIEEFIKSDAYKRHVRARDFDYVYSYRSMK